MIILLFIKNIILILIEKYVFYCITIVVYGNRVDE